jgi:hypothetical protein
LRPLTFTDIPSYWRARFEREEHFYRKLVSEAADEVSRVHRTDWWENYPGVAAALWTNLEAGLVLAYAGEWNLAMTQIRGRCLPYEIVLDSPEYASRLRAAHPGLASRALAATASALAFSRSITSSSLDRGYLELALGHYREALTQPDQGDLGEWRDQYEFLAIDGAMLALILGKFAEVSALFNLVGGFRVHKVYEERLKGLALTPGDEQQRTAFCAHFDDVRNMVPPAKWKRPAGCTAGPYRFTCGALVERIKTEWSGVPDWEQVCRLVAAP